MPAFVLKFWWAPPGKQLIGLATNNTIYSDYFEAAVRSDMDCEEWAASVLCTAILVSPRLQYHRGRTGRVISAFLSPATCSAGLYRCDGQHSIYPYMVKGDLLVKSTVLRSNQQDSGAAGVCYNGDVAGPW